MYRTTLLTILLLALTACSAPETPAAPGASATGATPADLANPASVHCREMGNTLVIQTDDDGGQQGICVFPDGSTCDEWAFFRKECGPALTATGKPMTPPLDNGQVTIEPGSPLPPGATETIVDWWGVIRKTDVGAQYDDYFERQDTGQPIRFGIDAREPALAAQIEAMRDSGQIVHLSGALYSNVPDYNGSQILVTGLVVAP
ncbi:MAG TPA: DUF333 domain-containing protein [Anaerolineales bacterium]|nr:DUF333 domain-containing protein [Anaerolineales bacterium]HRF46197.1 DUF333 domain-containing protein [Anaerolineales bacterium]